MLHLFSPIASPSYFLLSLVMGIVLNSFKMLPDVWSKLFTDCVHASNVNMFKNRMNKYLVRVGYTLNKDRLHLEYEWTLDKVITFLVCCLLRCSLDSNLV